MIEMIALIRTGCILRASAPAPGGCRLLVFALGEAGGLLIFPITPF